MLPRISIPSSTPSTCPNGNMGPVEPNSFLHILNSATSHIEAAHWIRIALDDDPHRLLGTGVMCAANSELLSSHNFKKFLGEWLAVSTKFCRWFCRPYFCIFLRIASMKLHALPLGYFDTPEIDSDDVFCGSRSSANSTMPKTLNGNT